MNRRDFIRSLSVLTAAAASPRSSLAAPVKWPIGCFNRPWGKWSYEETLDGIAAAGYKITGLLSGHKGEAFTSSAATPEYLAGLKKRIAQRGLSANMTAIRFRPQAPLAENIADLRRQIDNSARSPSGWTIRSITTIFTV